MTPAEACQQVHDLLMEIYGEIDCHCDHASVALALVLRAHGFEARAVAGSAHAHWSRPKPPAEPRPIFEPHCWVECEGWRLDPTAHQFRALEDAPLVSPLAQLAGSYREEETLWGPAIVNYPTSIEQLELATENGSGSVGEWWTPAQNRCFHESVAQWLEQAQAGAAMLASL